MKKRQFTMNEIDNLVDKERPPLFEVTCCVFFVIMIYLETSFIVVCSN